MTENTDYSEIILESYTGEPESVYGILDFQKLECWKSAVDFRKQIARLTQTFPGSEKYQLTSQLIRASRSVSANIAEGYGRFHFKDQIKFCINARGSLTECCDHLIVAEELGFINKGQLDKLLAQAESAGIILNGYIRYLRKRMNETENKN